MPTIVCKSCENECNSDDVTFEDHGVCYDCHTEILNQERCSGCHEVGHAWYNCPYDVDEGWYEYRYNPFTNRYRLVDVHPSLTNSERNR